MRGLIGKESLLVLKGCTTLCFSFRNISPWIGENILECQQYFCMLHWDTASIQLFYRSCIGFWNKHRNPFSLGSLGQELIFILSFHIFVLPFLTIYAHNKVWNLEGLPLSGDIRNSDAFILPLAFPWACNNHGLVFILPWKKDHHYLPWCTWPLNPDNGCQQAHDFTHAVARSNHKCVGRVFAPLKVFLPTDFWEYYKSCTFLFLALLSSVSVNHGQHHPQNIQEKILRNKPSMKFKLYSILRKQDWIQLLLLCPAQTMNYRFAQCVQVAYIISDSP